MSDSGKRDDELTTDEAVRALFPSEVVGEVRRRFDLDSDNVDDESDDVMEPPPRSS
jgi:hypothetical protein